MDVQAFLQIHKSCHFHRDVYKRQGLLKKIESQYISGKKEIKVDGEFKVPANPTAVDSQGQYFLDLISLQKDYPGVTAKERCV